MPLPFSKTFVRCAAFTVAGVFSALLRRPPAALLQEMPTLNLPDEREKWTPVLGCMRFLDARQNEWQVESSNFPKSGRKSDADPKVEVLRLNSAYLSDAARGGRPAPFMRVVGYFPNAHPQDVFEFMTDLQLRPKWDRNYHMFRKWESDGNDAWLEAANAVHRPIETVAKKTPVCKADVCLLLPDVKTRVLEQGWFAHRVGHSLLERFGIADRLFVYHRRSVCYSGHENTNNDLRMFDVLYSGSDELLQTAVKHSNPFAEWARSLVAEREVVRVSINYQHILILPIADAESQLWTNSQKLCCSGSMIDEKTTRNVYDIFSNSIRLYKEKNKIEGSLMIMTSANDAQIPTSVPMWAQKMMASFFSNHAYRELLKAIRAHRDQRMILD